MAQPSHAQHCQAVAGLRHRVAYCRKPITSPAAKPTIDPPGFDPGCRQLPDQYAGVLPDELGASIGSFSEDTSDARTDEYRIGFTLRQVPKSSMASSGRCTAKKTTTSASLPSTPQAVQSPWGRWPARRRWSKSSPCCKQPASRASSSMKNASAWNFATTAAPRSTPTWTPNWCMQEMPEDAPQAPGHLH